MFCFMSPAMQNVLIRKIFRSFRSRNCTTTFKTVAPPLRSKNNTDYVIGIIIILIVWHYVRDVACQKSTTTIHSNLSKLCTQYCRSLLVRTQCSICNYNSSVIIKTTHDIKPVFSTETTMP